MVGVGLLVERKKRGRDHADHSLVIRDGADQVLAQEGIGRQAPAFRELENFLPYLLPMIESGVIDL